MLQNTPKISIIITNLYDNRIFNLIDSLRQFNCYEIIVADGGSSTEHIEKLKKIKEERLKVYILPGSIAVTRNKVTSLINGDIVVFIDTDELPFNPEWLTKLTTPIVKGETDFTFGPTRPMYPANNRIARYVDQYDEWMYSNLLTVDISRGAMGNSAWKTEIIRELDFDTALTMGGEDYDLTIRALQAGYRGVFVPDAVLLHDQNNIKTLWRFLKKKFSYLLGAALAYKKNRISGSRIRSSVRGSIVLIKKWFHLQPIMSRILQNMSRALAD